MSRSRGIAVAFLFAALTFSLVAQQPGMLGFPADAVAEERQREEAFRTVPDAERLRADVKTMSAGPHHAGSPGSRAVAEYALQQLRAAGLNAWIEEFEAYMPMPAVRRVELVAPDSYTAALREPPIPGDPTASPAGQIPTFNAYSADGDVTGDLVYVNYGTPEDYARLADLGISVKGRIAIARYGRSWRGIKPKLAYEHGAIGCLLYSDPRDDGYFQNDVYPKGPARPDQGVQRGSVLDMPIYPGDPLTPGWASEPGGRKLAPADAVTLLKIPVLPISYADALPLLKAIGGPVAPEPWRGALPITYHVGPGPARVHLEASFEWANRRLYNVLARIDGSDFPNEWILYGNHHDAWVNGASDPVSGAAVVLETARGLGRLLKDGWRPKRSIVLALWDGEEWGLLGSTEWVEKHATELAGNAVVYINTDGNAKGWFSAGGSHSLQQLATEVARDTTDPRTHKPILDLAREKGTPPGGGRGRRDADRDSAVWMSALGSGSDYAAFLDHLAIASMNIGFTGEGQNAGVYHSGYDTDAWYTRFSDGDFIYGRTLAQVAGVLMMRLADAPVVPFQFSDYARIVSWYVSDVQRSAGARKESDALEFSPLTSAVSALEAAGRKFDATMAGVARTSSPRLWSRQPELAELNRLIYTSERRLAYETGLPRRAWYKHLVYAPGLYTGYGVKTLPMIREGLEEGHWDEAKQGITATAHSVSALASQIDAATRALTEMLNAERGTRNAER